MEKMRSLIKNKLKALGIEQLFYLGNGATNSKSEIHFRINKNKADLFDKSYAIQFEEVSETIAIWDLRKRLLIIPGLSEPPVRTLRATIPENGSHIFR